MDSDVNQLNLKTGWGWLMVDHQAKVARVIFSWALEGVLGNDRRTVQSESR